jgi:hypothetical protein
VIVADAVVVAVVGIFVVVRIVKQRRERSDDKILGASLVGTDRDVLGDFF